LAGKDRKVRHEFLQDYGRGPTTQVMSTADVLIKSMKIKYV